MELLSFFLSVFGLFILAKGIKPTLEFINKTTEKELVKLFESAMQPRLGKSASLVLLDDSHLICPRRQGLNHGADRLSATLLALLDGLDHNAVAQRAPVFNDNSRGFVCQGCLQGMKRGRFSDR